MLSSRISKRFLLPKEVNKKFDLSKSAEGVIMLNIIMMLCLASVSMQAASSLLERGLTTGETDTEFSVERSHQSRLLGLQDTKEQKEEVLAPVNRFDNMAGAILQEKEPSLWHKVLSSLGSTVLLGGIEMGFVVMNVT